MKLLSILLLIVFQQASGVIYRLNATEYAKLPALYFLEPYPQCLLAPGDTYCYLDAKLVANETSELLNTLQEFSAYTKTHFNRTVVHRGVCVTQSCSDYLNSSTDLVGALEACLNASFYESHRLQTRVLKDRVLCSKYGEDPALDTADYLVAFLALVLVVLNVFGSVYEYLFHVGSSSTGARLLLCFSARRNWRRLCVPAAEGPEPKLRRLKSFTGLKTITTIFVIMGHSSLKCFISTINPEEMENIFHNTFMYIILNGSVIIQTFFIVSAFLQSYNILVIGEKRTVGWKMLPQAVMFRWLRLTPMYAAVLAFVATWQRHLGTGPLWKSTVEVETLNCRRDWYYNLLYVNNYVDNSDCMLHTWYLGADMQLSIIGLIIFCLATSAKARKVGIAIAFLVGLLTPGLHTYFQNLNPILIASPEVTSHYFVKDPTFNNQYKRGHTNLLCYAVGMALALLIYRLQEQNFDARKYKKYRPTYWALVPVAMLVIMSGGFLYIDGFEAPAAMLAVYASTLKLVYGLISAVLIGGTIFKYENVYRGVLEWRGWAPLGRVAYGAYLVHFTVIRATVGSSVLSHSSSYHIIMGFLGAMCASFILALPMWMMIEAPFGGLVKVCLYPRPKEDNLKKNMSIKPQNVGESKEIIEVKL